MAQSGRRGHVVDPVDDFVSQPVAFREPQEVVVGESSIRTSRWYIESLPSIRSF